MSWASNFEDFKRPATTLRAFGGRPSGRGRIPVGDGRRGGAGGPSAGGIGAQLQLQGDGRDVQMIAELSPAVSVSVCSSENLNYFYLTLEIKLRMYHIQI